MNASRRPIARKKVGRFEVALFRFENRRLDTNDTEHVSMSDRVCVTYSRYRRDKREYESTRIWCNSDELRDLAQALDELNDVPEVPAPTKEEVVSSSSSRRSEATLPEAIDIAWAGPEDLTEEDDAEIGLDAAELDRLQYFAEHPELADPVLSFASRGAREYLWI